MTKEQALAEFYRRNGIDPAQLGRCPDPRLEQLPETVTQWLRSIDEADHPLFLRLLSRYTYLTQETSVHRYERAVDLLENALLKQDLSLQDVLFVSTESSGSKKSGSDHVRTDLHRRCIGRIDAEQIVSAVHHLDPEEPAEYRAIAFVDDILGTGFTLWETIQRFCETFPDTRNKPLFLLCVIPTDRGLRFLNRKAGTFGVRLSILYEEAWRARSAFKQPDLFDPSELADVRQRIERYEALIDSYMKDPDKTYVLGFYGCQQLVSFYYNTPNNTLCTFWRWTDTHRPLFPREKQAQRPRVSALRETARRGKDTAYRIRSEDTT